MEIVHEANSFTDDTTIKAEGFLLAELRHFNENDSRMYSESSVTFTVYLFSGIMSIIFLLRFIQIVQWEFHNVVAVNKIRAFYIASLKAQMPAIGEAFPKQDTTAYASHVAFYIPYVVFLVGSLSFGGANYVIFENLVWSLCVFAIAFLFQQSYYHLYLSRLKNEPDPSAVELGKQRETSS